MDLLPARPPNGQELLAGPGSLLLAAGQVARRASVPTPRGTCAATCRAFAAFRAARLGRPPTPTDLAEHAVAEDRDRLRGDP